PPTISVEPFLSHPGQITYLTHARDGSGRLFLVEKAGRIRVVQDGRVLEEPFLDIRRLIDAGPSERGLLSVAFAPDFADSGRFYVYYTGRRRGETVVARYRVRADGMTADPDTAEILLTVAQPAPNHNGGQLQFGPDGYLYIGLGDGGRAGDPWDNAESLDTLLGKLLRLDVSAMQGYAVPADNPFAGRPDARPEIWAYGLRNPWRFSFDRATGDLFIADVGQNRWEEIDYQPASSTGGEHYGWDTMEGSHCFEPAEGCDTTGKVMPVAEYSHQEGCSVTGGYVYRGAAYPFLDGIYFYGDFCTGRIWALQQQPDGSWQTAAVLDSGISIASFGEDEEGELYILDLKGDIFRLVGVQ
ncbi:MAG: glucose dehydrogenase, partial [Caldilineae bacterium]